MRILITGGAGFLGSHLVEHYLKQGHSVAIVDNYATGRRENLAGAVGAEVVEGTISDTALVNRIFDSFKPTHVIHSAAAYKNADAWKEDIDSNVLGTVNVVQAAKRTAVQRLVYFQTSLAYGRAKTVPIPPNEDLKPFTSYSISKAAGEQYVAMSGLSYVTLRLANIYGPRLFTGPQPVFFKKLKAGEKCTIVNTRRDFLAIEDFFGLMDKVIAFDAPTGAFNVASGRDISIPDVFDLIAQGMGLAEGSYPAPEVKEPSSEDLNSLLLDPSQTEKAFGWKPKLPVHEGTMALVKWYEKNGVGETFTHFKKV
jgi:UDP-glucose 4-epimerase